MTTATSSDEQIAAIRRSLLARGWTVEVLVDGSCIAYHRELVAERDLREELHEAGLLTSRSFRIDLGYHPPHLKQQHGATRPSARIAASPLVHAHRLRELTGRE
jgi:hypothetical protein